MARLEPPDYAAHVARIDAERARQHLAAWGLRWCAGCTRWHPAGWCSR